MTFIWTWLVGSKLGRAVGMILGVLAFAGSIFLGGRRYEKQDRKIEDLEDYVDTKEKIDDVEKSDDRDAAVERLRDNGWL